MPSRRAARTLLLALLTVGCGRPRADTRAPEAAAEAAGVPVGHEAAALASAEPVVQSVSFADDADPEPTTQVQAAPKRPPLPRFRLFGTRENDGPH